MTKHKSEAKHEAPAPSPENTLLLAAVRILGAHLRSSAAREPAAQLDAALKQYEAETAPAEA